MVLGPRYERPDSRLNLPFNQWDIIILFIMLGLFAGLVLGAQQMATPYQLGQTITISTDPAVLPQYALNTVLRMLLALILSFFVTFTVGTLAAKSERAERIILPLVDILQSVPVLGFLSITVMGFIWLFEGSQLGPECAAVFAIFTSQVWNMILSLYQSLRTVPKELREAAAIYQLSAWQTFWKIEVPFATPGLIWNTMISLSAGWFFVVASEAISVNNQEITLPGIGSYIMMAQKESNYAALGWVILTMLAIIVMYDQLIFRPLLAWSERFKSEPDLENEGQGHWFLDLLQRSYIVSQLKAIRHGFHIPQLFKPWKSFHLSERTSYWVRRGFLASLDGLLLVGITLSLYWLWQVIRQDLTLSEIRHVFYLGAITGLKVFILIILASVIWVPIGVWVGLRPRLANWVQPIAQFLAAFPVNLVYPVLFILITQYNLNVEVWTTPLMVLGTQWYILFNVIVATLQLPQEMKWAVSNYGVRGWLKWRKFVLPGIFPFYVTGAMATAGGCWNASIVSDVVSWGDVTLKATGLGGYIAEVTTSGDFPRIALGIAVMCLYVVVINRLIWRKLYLIAESRYVME